MFYVFCLERAHVCLGGGRGLPGGPRGASLGLLGGSRLQTTRAKVTGRLLIDVQKTMKILWKNVYPGSQGGAAELVVGELEGSLGGLWVVLVGSWGVLGWSWCGLGLVLVGLGGGEKSPRTARSD